MNWESGIAMYILEEEKSLGCVRLFVTPW